MVVEIDTKAAPLAAENFVTLCAGIKGKSSNTGKPLHYVGCPFHRIVKGFVAQVCRTTYASGSPSHRFHASFKAAQFFLWPQPGTPRRAHGHSSERYSRSLWFVLNSHPGGLKTGDIATGTGAGGESIWGKKFKDDKVCGGVDAVSSAAPYAPISFFCGVMHNQTFPRPDGAIPVRGLRVQLLKSLSKQALLNPHPLADRTG